MDERAFAILRFWFGAPGDPEYGKTREIWFKATPEFDAKIRARFLDDYQKAVAGTYESWRQGAQPGLALILLLDQFPRNMFRGKPQSFASDKKGLEVAKAHVAKGHDLALSPLERHFCYLPFMHSEGLEDQRRCLALVEARLRNMPGYEAVLHYAKEHLALIERFGRFPHRNAIVGRRSTPEEAVFLAASDEDFGTRPQENREP